MMIELHNVYAKVIHATDHEAAWLLSFLQVPSANPMGTSWSAYNQMYQTFPAGLIPLIETTGRERGMRVEVLDRRVRSCAPVFRGADLAWLHDYQDDAVEAGMLATRGVFDCPTASGKGEIVAAFTRVLPCTHLLLAHRSTIVEELADRVKRRTGEDVQTVISGTWPRKFGRIVAATFQTVHAAIARKDPRVADLMLRSECLHADECFPAGTLVDGRRIETLRRGDVITAYNERTDAFVARRVMRTFMRVPSALVRVTIGKDRVICTPEHRFFTRRGWRAACSLCSEDVLAYGYADTAMRSMRSSSFSDDDAGNRLRVLRYLPSTAATRAREACNWRVQSLWSRGGFDGATRFGTVPEGCSVLFSRAQAAVDVCAQVGSGEGDRYEVRGGGIQENARAQSDVQRSSTSTGFRYALWNRTLSACARWQWACDAYSAEDVVRFVGAGIGWLAERICCAYSRREQSTAQCKNRLGESELHARGGSGRSQPRCAGAAGAGCAEERVSSWRRVDSVEVLERGSDGTFGGLCPDGLVYNVEVDTDHAYTANGFVVHNCHVVAAKQFARVARAAKRAYWRFGYSGTPYNRSDARGIMVVGWIGPTIYKIENAELVARGTVAKGNVRIIPYTLTSALTGEWADVYEEQIVCNVVRNELVVNAALVAPKPVLVAVQHLAHGRELLKLLRKRGLQADFVHGEHNTGERNAQMRRLDHCDLDVLVSSRVLQEGANIPNLRTLVNAAGGKAIIPVAQFTGRAARRHDRSGAVVKDEFYVYDIDDRHCGCRYLGHDGEFRFRHRACRWLSEHAAERMRVYRDLGHTVSFV